MAKVPKPRGEGGRGGMRYQGTQAASAKRGGDPGRYGGPPPKKGCDLFALLALVYVLTPVLAAGGIVYYHAIT